MPRTDCAIQPAGWLGGPHFRWPPVFPQAAVLATARWMCCAGVAKARPRVGSLMGNKMGTYNTKVYIIMRFVSVIVHPNHHPLTFGEVFGSLGKGQGNFTD